MTGQARLKALTAFRKEKKHTHKSQTPPEKLNKINTLNTAFKSVNRTRIHISRQTVPNIDYSFTKEGATYTRIVCFVEFIHMPSGMRYRAQKKIHLHQYRQARKQSYNTR